MGGKGSRHRLLKGSGWGHQSWVLGEICRLVTPLTPLVLHLQGAASDPLGREPLADVKSILSHNGTPLWVPLYLHSFIGGPSQVDEWVATGRVVFFGVSGLCFFSQEQIKGVWRIPTDRLLLDTHSPHLPVGPKEMGHIGFIYRRVAEIRQIDVRRLAAQVRANFAILFGPQLRRAPLPEVE